jgi:hypothetical protein
MIASLNPRQETRFRWSMPQKWPQLSRLRGKAGTGNVDDRFPETDRFQPQGPRCSFHKRRFTTVNLQNLPILRDLVALFTILFRISVSKLMSDGYNEGECVPNIRRGWDAESRLSN